MKELITAVSLLYSIPVTRIVSLKDEKVFTVFAKKERFVLKLLGYPAMETAFITDAMNYLSAGGFHDFNEIIPTAGGKPFGRWKQKLTLLTKELKGRSPSYKNPKDTAAVAAYLGRLHNAASHFFPLHPYGERMKWGKMIETMEKGGDDLVFLARALEGKSEAEKDDFDRAFLCHREHAIEEARLAAEALRCFYPVLSERKRNEGGFCHHDPAHHNFLIDGGGNVGAFDFDYAIADVKTHDLAALMLKVLKANRWNALPALKAAEHYLAETAVEREELWYLYELLAYPYDFHHAVFARYVEHNHGRRIEKKLFRLVRDEEKRQTALKEIKTALGVMI